MKNFTTKSAKNLLLTSIVLFLASCYNITEIRQPASVSPGSEFEVVIKAGIQQTNEQPNNEANALAGIMLPADWSLSSTNKCTYSIWKDNAVIHTEDMEFDADYTNLCNDNLTTTGEYTWIGLKSKTAYDYAHYTVLDSVVCKIYVKTSTDANGDYQLQYVIGDNGQHSDCGNPFTAATTPLKEGSSYSLSYQNYIAPLLSVTGTSGVYNPNADNNIIRYEYFDINGKKLNGKPTKGFYIESCIHENGSRTSRIMGVY